MTYSVEYPKTENLYTRNEETHKLTGILRAPEFDIPKVWHVTEKIDGTNMRICYDPAAGTVEVRGRSDRANIAGDLKERMLADFPVEKLSKQFDWFIGEERIEQGACVTIFGEGYGPGIQRGGHYGPAKDFRMFDVMYHWPLGMVDDDETATYAMKYRNSWCQPSTVEMIADDLGVKMVPTLGQMKLEEMVVAVRRLQEAEVALDGPEGYIAEGIIARTDPYIYNERGSRVMFKLKGCDL